MIESLALLGGAPVRSTPFPAWPVAGPADHEAVQEVLASGAWAYLSRQGAFGSQTTAFHAAFAARHNAIHALLVANGSVALEVALLAAGIGRGDEVILPPLTFVATANAVVRSGAVPVFADVDPQTLCLDPSAVEAALTPRTRAVIPVHLGCCLADMDAFSTLAARHNLILIEDCAHVAGARWQGRGVGSFGALGCFSFQLTKPLTCGEGGAVVTSVEELEVACYALLNCGRSRPGDVVRPLPLGWNLRLGELQAALLNSQFQRLDFWMDRREANARLLLQGLADLSWVESVRLDERVTRRQYYYLTLRYKREACDGLPRDLVVRALQAEGVPTQLPYVPLYRDPLLVDAAGSVRPTPYGGQLPAFHGVDCPVAENAVRHEIVNLPHPILLGSERDVQDAVEAFHKIDRHRNQLATAYP